jgi:ankyrin repeat protein
LAAGLLIGLSVFFWERKIQNYLDTVELLPDLDIHTLRLKRQAGEPLTMEKNAEATLAGDMIGMQSDDEATAGQETDNAAAGEQEFSETPSPGKDKSLRLIVYASGALLFIILAGIIINRGSLAEWYYTKKLGSRGVPFSEQAFLAEVAKNNEEAVELFLKAGVNREAVNDKGQTALMIASEKGYAVMLGKLGKQGSAAFNRVDASGDTALMIASRQGREEAVNALLDRGADVNYTVPSRDGAATALQAALDVSDLKEGQAGVVQSLLKRGADAKGRNAAGRSPLWFAADHGRTEAAGALIDHGAEVNDADLKGDFALLAAACKGHSGLVALLAEKGANMKMTLPDGQTPLMCAARGGHGDAVRVLVEKGAAINAKSASGSTALADAAVAGKVDIVKILLAQGADPGSGSVPDAFRNLRGRAVAISAKRSTLTDALGRIAKTASQDGYTISVDRAMTKTISLKTKAPWNKVLHELAAKNHLLLVVKDKEIFVVPYDPAAIKRGSM